MLAVRCGRPAEGHRVLLLGQFISLLITFTGIFSQFLNRYYEVRERHASIHLEPLVTCDIPADCERCTADPSAGDAERRQLPAAVRVPRVPHLALAAAGRVLARGAQLLVLSSNTSRFRLTLAYSTTDRQLPWWKYLLLALADVEGNFLVVCAYKYTSISSVMLLDCFTIPVVMLLSATFLHAKYTRAHKTAVLFCLLGIGVLVASDILRDGEGFLSSSWNVSALYGDFLCLLGSATYACSNVGQEYLVKKKDRRMEFLGMVGGLGFLISSAQAAYFEGDVLRAVDWYDTRVESHKSTSCTGSSHSM